MTKKYDFVASLGPNCACAELLNKLYLRRESGPFDWIRGIPFEQRCQLILNGFPHFIDKKYLQYRGPDPNSPDHAIYVHSEYKTEFLHDFPSTTDLKEALPPIQAQYQRRIARFLSHFYQTQKILLVFISPDGKEINLLLPCIAALNEKYTSAQVSLLYIAHNDSLSMEETIEQTLEKNVYYVQINNSPTEHTDPFLTLQGNIPVVNDVICRYTRNISYKKFLAKFQSLQYKFLFSIARFCSNFSYSKEHRRKRHRRFLNKIVDFM